MRRFVLALLVAIAASAPTVAHAQVSGLGLGLIVGEPTGVTARGMHWPGGSESLPPGCNVVDFRRIVQLFAEVSSCAWKSPEPPKS